MPSGVHGGLGLGHAKEGEKGQQERVAILITQGVVPTRKIEQQKPPCWTITGPGEGRLGEEKSKGIGVGHLGQKMWAWTSSYGKGGERSLRKEIFTKRKPPPGK